MVDPHVPPQNATRPIELAGLTVAGRDVALVMEMSGADAGRAHALDEAVVTIGRGDDCTLVFADNTLSRVHARILAEGEDRVLEDAGSLNGTYVNSDKVQRHVLQHGDRVRLGSGVRLLFQRVSPDEEQVLAKLYEAGVRDGLTGVFNRRHLGDHLAQEIAFAVRHGTDVCVLLMDLDHFKKVNDTHGHLAGDEVLRRLAVGVGAQVRREDLLARYGGEEFVIVVRGVPAASARVLAERVRASVESIEVPWEGQTLRMTLSIGVASLRSCGGDCTSARILARADEALYRAKDAGRNRVEVAPDS